jgi:tRNA A-37 threonylcarbamoyl transferase component Bud32
MSLSINDNEDKEFTLNFTYIEPNSMALDASIKATTLAVSEEGFMVFKTLEEETKVIKTVPSNDEQTRKEEDMLYYEFLIGKHLTSLNNSIFGKTYAYATGKFECGLFTSVVQEYAKGKSLSQCVIDKSLSLKKLLRLYRYMAHQIGNQEFTHYDLHDENIIYNSESNNLNNSVKVIDFGRSYVPDLPQDSTFSVYCSAPVVLNGYTAPVFDPYIDFVQIISNLSSYKKELGNDKIDYIINEFKRLYLNHNLYNAFEDICFAASDEDKNKYYDLKRKQEYETFYSEISSFDYNNAYQQFDLVMKIVPYPLEIAKSLEKYALMLMNASHEGYLSLGYNTSNLQSIDFETTIIKLDKLLQEYNKITNQKLDYDQQKESETKWGKQHQRELYDIIYGFKKWFVREKQGFVVLDDSNGERKKLQRKEFVEWFLSFLDMMIEKA